MEFVNFHLRVAQLEVIRVTEEERRREVQQLIDYYVAKPAQVINRRISDRFSEPETLKLSKHWRPVVKKIVRRTALSFQKPPEVMFERESDQKVFDELWDQLNLPAHLLTMDRYRRLCGSLLIRVDNEPSEPSGIAITYITPNVLDVPVDPDRPSRALQYRVFRSIDTSMGTDLGRIPGARVPDIQADRTSGDTAVRLRRPGTKFFGTESPQRQISVTGGIEQVVDVYDVADPNRLRHSVVSALGRELFSESLTFDPFVMFHDELPVDGALAPYPADLLSAQHRITDHVIELGHQFFLNAFSIPVVREDIEWPGGRVVLDPSRPIVRRVGRDGNDVPPVAYASPENDFTIQQLRDAIKEEEEAIMEAYGLVRDQSAATSGFQLAVMNLPLTRDLEMSETLLTASVRRFIKTLLRAKGIENPSLFTVRLVNSVLPEDPSSALAEVQRIQAEIQAGLTSVVRVLMERHPDLTEDEAKALAKEIAEEQKAIVGDPLERALELRGMGRERRPVTPLPEADEDEEA